MNREDVPFSARGRCDSCDGPVIWATTAKGKPMPVDADPHPAGTLELARTQFGGIRATVVPGAPNTDDDRRDLHRSHFATCPKADDHRRRR